MTSPAPVRPGLARACLVSALLWSVPLNFVAAQSSPADLAFFESRIRPLLAEQCFSCHGEEKQKGHLRLDSREAIHAGGESGPVLVEGHPERSRLIRAVSQTDPDLQMPPKKKLSNRQVADLKQWILAGAPWPAADSNQAALPKSSGEITDRDRGWWAFQPIRRRPAPFTRFNERALNPIDRFVFAELERKSLTPNPPAAPRELIRRAYFDLIGLPPPPEEVAAFARDPSPAAWERVIDDLLARPQYGERWARHWLDVVRFAQSNGYERDGEKPYAWRYRDYVVRALNQDKPYDRFICEQIAGDELEPATFDSIIATGFQRLGVWDDEPDDKRMAEFDELDDILSTTATAFLGLTIGCARCHEHKFDPIPQADYYRLLSFFRNVTLYENARYTLESPNYVPLVDPPVLERFRSEQQMKVNQLQEEIAGTTNAESKKKLTSNLERVKVEAPAAWQWALAIRERGPKSPPTHLLVRGNAATPGPEVEPGFLSVLGTSPSMIPSPAPEARTSGRRRILANWIASPDNPLTARVMANRVWQHHFGRGIAKTTSDLGRAGNAPSHPQLLDWLAAELIGNGWSLKKLHKTIMQSATYQLSSRVENPRALEADPGNELFWRQNLRRLEAESLRDTVLAISGQLNSRMAGRGFFPRLSGEVLAGQSRPGLDWEMSARPEISRRSLYAYVRRTMPIPVFEAFDYNNTATPLSERTVTTVAPQALILLNDEFMQSQAAALAKRLVQESGSTPVEQIRRGFQLAVGRFPTRQELKIGRDFLEAQEDAFEKLGSRRMFRPEVAASLSVDYMNRLKPNDFLIGPDVGWTYHRGSWSSAYEGIRTVDRARGPFALASQVPFADGMVKVTLLLHQASEFAGVLIRGVADGDELRGYEVHLDPRTQRLALRRHAKGMASLAEVPCEVPTGQPISIRIEAAGARLRVWWNGQAAPLLEVTDPAPHLDAGRVGVKTWGAALSIDEVTLRCGGQVASVLSSGITPSPRQRALESFCLLLLNLNEVAYVD